MVCDSLSRNLAIMKFFAVCHRLSTLALLGLLVACGSGVTDGTGPVVPPVDTTTPPGTVQRGTITVRVTVDPADAGVASAIGLSVSGLTVRLKRTLSTDPERIATTGADGSARFENQLEGLYQASLDRPLSATELAQLPMNDQDAMLFAGGARVTFKPPQGEITVTLVASRRGGLVISELFSYQYPENSVVTYGFGTYLEVYNASDTTMYVDGFIIARSWGGMHIGVVDEFPCHSFNFPARMDSSMLWLSVAHQFPGNGNEYPIRPGEAKVVAMDAMNHIAASPLTNQLNLSNADFELHGDDADIENPFVPNMVTFRGGTGVIGRGHPFLFGNVYALLVPAAATQFIPAALNGFTGVPYPVAKVPRMVVADMVAIADTPERLAATSFYQGGGRRCLPFISPAFDRDVSLIGDYYVRQSMRRKSLGFAPTGVELLQRTRTSSRDFEYAEPLRRSLNK